MSDVFVSWSGQSARKIRDLIRSLFDRYQDAFKVFLSSRDIQTGTQWQDNLLDNLDNADDGVAIFSQEAIKSDWLIHESAVLSSRLSSRTISLIRSIQTGSLSYLPAWRRRPAPPVLSLSQLSDMSQEYSVFIGRL